MNPNKSSKLRIVKPDYHIIANYRNRVINDDVLNVLRQLPDNSVDMVYGDPDYNVGINYSGKSYTRKWDDYIAWYVDLTKESMRVLKPSGNLFMINYPKQNSYLRVKYLDQHSYDVQDYVWVYNSNIGHSPKRFTTAHRSILHARKTKDSNFYKDHVPVPYKNPNDKRIIKQLEKGSKGCMPYSWMYFDLVKNVSKHKTFHACQIPVDLASMLIESCTKQNDDVFILFGGSGSELVLCKELNRNFISCETHPEYYQLILSRLKNGGKINDEYHLRYMRHQSKKAG